MVALLDQFGNRMATPKERAAIAIRAKWDAVQTTPDNARHWAMADGLSARAAASPDVRRKFRNRSRYEVDNNSYAKGIVLTLANHTIGTGPRLQVLLKNQDHNRIIQQGFMRWARRIRLAEKLRTMRVVRSVDGEAFGVLVTNMGLAGPIKLDLLLVEADLFTTPNLSMPKPNAVDGIVFDESGNPIEYHKLKHHPGDLQFSVNPKDMDTLPASAVIHMFRMDRPGQVRGIPEIAPALPLFAQLRRFTIATLAAAETAADHAAVLYSDAPAGFEGVDTAEDNVFDTIPIEHRMMLTLPYGWKMGQFKAEHPTTTYEMFKRALLQEIARCLNMPFNIAAGDSSSYNYSSGRLDHQTYFRAVQIDQDDFEQRAVERMFAAYLDEAALIPGYLPDGIGLLDELPHQWHWDEIEDIDPEKTANSDESRIGSGTLTRARAYARQGLDVDEEDRKAAECYGVTVEEYRKALFKKHFSGPSSAPAPKKPVPAGGGDDEEDEDVDDEE